MKRTPKNKKIPFIYLRCIGINDSTDQDITKQKYLKIKMCTFVQYDIFCLEEPASYFVHIYVD